MVVPLLSIAVLLTFSAPETPSPSIHFEEAQQHRFDAPTSVFSKGTDRLFPIEQELAQETTARAYRKVVFGYLPYWEDVEDVPWNELTHLAFFSQEIDANGELGNDHGWNTDGADLAAVAHSHGVRLILTVSLFDPEAIETLLDSANNRKKAIDAILASVLAQDGDGVNVDFEFVPPAAKESFVAFVEDLTLSFHQAVPDAHVSIATPAVDWKFAYDFDALAEACDGLNIMGYDYHWKGGDPGPISPIRAGSVWRSRDLEWTINDYLAFGGRENRHKMILGLPLYGRDWPATNTQVPGTSAGEATSLRMRDTCSVGAFSEEAVWDRDSQTPYRVYEAGGGTHQQFCENEASLNAKLDLIDEHDLGGVMFWALGQVPNTHPLWASVHARFLESENGEERGLSCVSTTETSPSITLLLGFLFYLYRRRPLT